MIMSMSKNHELGIFMIMSMSQLTTFVSEFMNFWRFVVILRDRVHELLRCMFMIFREPVSNVGGIKGGGSKGNRMFSARIKPLNSVRFEQYMYSVKAPFKL